jgi:hypothetical protein
MNSLVTLVNRWQLPPQFLQELLAVMGAAVPTAATTPVTDTASEAGTQSRRILRAARQGYWLLRNNSGACQDATGRLVRYGLGHTSPETIKVMKSSDLIGITPIVITPAHVGYTAGIFTAEECKAPTWKFRQSDDRAVAQFNFIKKVQSLGGIAKFVTDPEAP